MDDEREIQKQLERQTYAIGKDAQEAYRRTSVLIVGLSGLGCEIAKNLILSGVKMVTLLDDMPLAPTDLSSLFFASKADLGKPRASIVCPKLAELNRFVVVKSQHGAVTEDLIKAHSVVAFCDQPTTQLTKENAWARANGVRFVACESRGAMGCVFVDAGPEFKVIDKNSVDLSSSIVTGMNAADGTVFCFEEQPLVLDVGDKVHFSNLNTTPDISRALPPGDLLTVRNVLTPSIFQIEVPEELRGTARDHVDVHSGFVHTTKQPIYIDFLPLPEAIKNPNFVFISDSEEKFTAPSQLHATFQALHAFMSSHGHKLPSIPAEVEEVLAAVKKEAGLSESEADIFKLLIETAQGNLNPMSCLVGGLAAQEVLKVCSGKYTPMEQWFYYDVREILDACPSSVDRRMTGSRYDGQLCVLGHEFQKRCSNTSAFVVGAGAIGCELLKNVACIGIGCGGRGQVTVTDMDTIELSNLSRQFFFRNKHIGKFKSEIAAEAVQGMNPELRIRHKIDKVSQETEGTFDDEFWDSQDVVLNALDNVLARKYVDSRCSYFAKPLFESGTLGPKCSTQAVVPHTSETYSRTVVEEDKGTAQSCTIKNLPNAIEHTIQWARENFFRLFNEEPRDVQSYLQDPEFGSKLDSEPAVKPIVLQRVKKSLEYWPSKGSDCIVWARLLFEELFVNNIKQLLFNIPNEKVGVTGEKFWTSWRRRPTPQEFNVDKAEHFQFVKVAARLLGDVYGVDAQNLTDGEIKKIVNETSVPAFAPCVFQYALSEQKKEKEVPVMAAELTLDQLPPRMKFSDLHLQPLEFEKDDETNGHIDFITLTSNLRASSYGIPEADIARTKLIGGQIIPAMITTTAFVTGLVGFEVMKYLLGEKRITHYRNAFVNIAVPIFAFSDPIKVGLRSRHRAGNKEWVVWTSWTRIDVGEGQPLKIQELLFVLGSKHGIKVLSLSTPKGKLLYECRDITERRERRKLMLVEEVVAEVAQEELPESARYIRLSAYGEVGKKECFSIPPIRYQFRFPSAME